MPPGADVWQLTRNCAIAPSAFFWNIAALGLAPFVFGKVHVEARCGGRRRVLDIHACWARLERGPCDSLVLRSGRDAFALGDQLTPARRRMFSQEFAASLARARLQDARTPAGDEDCQG